MSSTTNPAGDETTSGAVAIFVNRRRFEVKPGVTGAGIAALLGVPAENAVVEIEAGDCEPTELVLDAPVTLAPGQHFLVTRQYVMGGSPAGDGA
ncbi:hypothetical protein J2Y55_000239 [Bosea sp. BE125]|uniref:multiubiquitin domain-containing protein n=1 Tax=Bosea sp. BE125 TaxID=2817909 RepID=UPI0028549098|nr:multiubiquitin domain-containing protein [Bosea sp. BE125]MDR6869246.1 hypothetical protein [Bosea sp. BE125]